MIKLIHAIKAALKGPTVALEGSAAAALEGLAVVLKGPAAALEGSAVEEEIGECG